MNILKVLNYNIYIGNNILSDLAYMIRQELPFFSKIRRIAVVTDENLASLPSFAAFDEQLKILDLPYQVTVLPPGESTKCMENLSFLYSRFHDFGISRSDLIIAFGGGVIGDLTGFASATFQRGIAYVQIPTSLLAQVDSSIGGKTAVDLPQGKNLAGAFYQPSAVFIDTSLLASLPSLYFSDGMAEVIKYGCIASPQLFDLLAENDLISIQTKLPDIVMSCCEIKKRYVEEDEKDKGCRMLLNFGHTIGHGIEKYFGYESYTHGQCVAIGMTCITRKSEAMGLSKPGAAEKIRDVLKCYGLPFEMPGDISSETLLSIITGDKKRLGDEINFVLLHDIGSSFLHKTRLSDIGNFL